MEQTLAEKAREASASARADLARATAERAAQQEENDRAYVAQAVPELVKKARAAVEEAANNGSRSARVYVAVNVSSISSAYHDAAHGAKAILSALPYGLDVEIVTEREDPVGSDPGFWSTVYNLVLVLKF